MAPCTWKRWRRQSERDLTIKELAKDTLARQPEANRRPILVCDASIRGEDSSIVGRYTVFSAVIKLVTPCVLYTAPPLVLLAQLEYLKYFYLVAGEDTPPRRATPSRASEATVLQASLHPSLSPSHADLLKQRHVLALPAALFAEALLRIARQESATVDASHVEPRRLAAGNV